MSIKRVLTNRRLALALTGLTPEEFTSLIPLFAASWQKAKEQDYRANSARVRAPGGGRRGFLKSMSEKLFYILFYYKCYPTYDLASFMFDCDRGCRSGSNSRPTTG